MIMDATNCLDSNTNCCLFTSCETLGLPYLSEPCFIFLFPFLFPLTGCHIAKDCLLLFFFLNFFDCLFF